MRFLPHPPTTLSSLIFLLPSLATAITLDCSDIRVDKKSFNLQALGGPHELHTIKERPPTITDTTIKLDICQALKKPKGVDKKEDCPNGSRVCAIERSTNTVDNTTIVSHVIPIAGDFTTSIGGHLDPVWERMKSSSSSADREREGIRLQIGGGKDEDGQKQKAIIEFLCSPNHKYEDPPEDTPEAFTAEDEEEGDGEPSSEEVDDEHGGRIKLLSWDDEEKTKVLRLEWTTQYACEDAKDRGDSESGGHWGFFTWFILIAFMGVAAYLIFGTWLNYNRYSARGWDLVPHSETIRDIPYIFRDWIRSVVNTVQGGGSRGGYSAV